MQRLLVFTCVFTLKFQAPHLCYEHAFYAINCNHSGPSHRSYELHKCTDASQIDFWFMIKSNELFMQPSRHTLTYDDNGILCIFCACATASSYSHIAFNCEKQTHTHTSMQFTSVSVKIII